ncbi:hypothetical protein BJY01DRAFT_231700 [Aspergillus pseudoustus]|uniref:Uncharacterized protein n=1 Tax=Aspergillus pseudoustus TaxID=1810923 RepID=A0ABR4KVX0_9EURO
MARLFYLIFAAASLTRADITVSDPSDAINPADWAADNAYIFDWNNAGTVNQEIAIRGPYTYNHQRAKIRHRVLEGTGNDTSVLVVANGSDVDVAYTTIAKFGYITSLNQASFYGVNAAINNANHSTLALSNVNVTTHNGAANVYTYGTGSVTYADNVWLYSSGPVSHGLYASGNGTVYAKNVRHYSGGTRCSSFSGDYPAGYLHVQDAVAHTDGVGSAICFLQGLCNMTNVIGYARNSPAMISDNALGDVTGIWTNSDLTAGLLGGMVMISDSQIRNGTTVVLDNTRLTVLGETTPGLWFGNVIATVDVIASTINTSSGILAVANYSYLTQDFNYYAGYDDNNNLSPAQATINIQDSDLSGSIVVYNRSSISFNLAHYSNWNGEATIGYGEGYLAVSLDNTSTWALTSNSVLQNFTNADRSLSNIISNGYNITYDAKSTANRVWGGKSYKLHGGGRLSPL